MRLSVSRTQGCSKVTVFVSCISSSDELVINQTKIQNNKFYWSCTRFDANIYYNLCQTSLSGENYTWTTSSRKIRKVTCQPVRQKLIKQSTQPSTTPTTTQAMSTAQSTAITKRTTHILKTSRFNAVTTRGEKSAVTTRGEKSAVMNQSAISATYSPTSSTSHSLYNFQTESVKSDLKEDLPVGMIIGISAAVLVIIIVVIITVIILRRRKLGQKVKDVNVPARQNNVYESDYSLQPARNTGVDEDNYNILHHRVRVRTEDIYQDTNTRSQSENPHDKTSTIYHLVEPWKLSNQDAVQNTTMNPGLRNIQRSTTPEPTRNEENATLTNRYKVFGAGGSEDFYSVVNKDQRAKEQAGSVEDEVIMVGNDIYEGRVEDEEVVYSLAE